ncbi:hypothetical protein K523DRAFT_419700 [Schizophyllum commune Tattone D]|nr:hypothetical protein K523DRAFT_419700 [Schizophyllum commune Tattone D]
MYAYEVAAFDLDTVYGWMDSLDAFLVFVGLFSTIVASFLIQSSQALQDYNKITASLLLELIAVQRAVAIGASSQDVPPSAFSLDSNTGQAIDVVINGLWIASLTISLASALVAVLAKQWLHRYTMSSSGTQRDRALLQQYRYTALERWHVPFIVGSLPLMLHGALFLFLAGLAAYFAPMDATLSAIVAGISGLTLVCYMAVHVLPLYKADCAYITPFTEYLYPALYVLQGWIDAKFHQHPARNTASSEEWASAFSLRAKQMEQARDDIDALAAESLIRLHAFSAHPSIPEIVTEVIAGLPGSSRTLSLLRRSRRLEEDAINH